jgi:hypothetical protein
VGVVISVGQAAQIYPTCKQTLQYWNKISKQGRKCEILSMFDMNLGCPAICWSFFSALSISDYIYAIEDGFYYEADFIQRKQILSGGDF